MVTIGVQQLGDYIRAQRRDAKISLRQLARLAGVSNPYLSQIERGLRKPSAEILQQIAKALRISAEALYVQAGILDQRPGSGEVQAAILADEALTERQKQVLVEFYESFLKENEGRLPGRPEATADDAATGPETTSAADAVTGLAGSAAARVADVAGRAATRAAGVARPGRRRASRAAGLPEPVTELATQPAMEPVAAPDSPL